MAVRKAASAKLLLLCGGEKGGLGSEKGGFGEAASPDVAVKMAALAKRLLFCGSQKGGLGEAVSLIWQ